MKRCTSCHLLKSPRCFYRQRGGAGGRMARCKTCKDAATQAWREVNWRRVLWQDRRRAMRADRAAYRRQYAKTARGREIQARAQRRYREFKRISAHG